VGLIWIQNGSPRNTVSVPKPRISVVESHSIGEIRPRRHFDTTSASTVAAMNTTVLLVIATTAPTPESALLSGLKWR
jgi:hypothetical protein